MFDTLGVVDLAWQTSFLGSAAPAIDASFASLYRVELDAASWIDVVPNWLSGADDVFARLVDTAPWSQRDRVMWGNLVPEPRLTSGWAEAKIRERVPVLMAARRRAQPPLRHQFQQRLVEPLPGRTRLGRVAPRPHTGQQPAPSGRHPQPGIPAAVPRAPPWWRPVDPLRSGSWRPAGHRRAHPTRVGALRSQGGWGRPPPERHHAPRPW